MEKDELAASPDFLLLARQEWFLPLSILSAVAFFFYGDSLAARLADPLGLALLFAWLFFVVLGSALSVVRHADQLAERLGEPYGTLILTLTVTTIEVVAISRRHVSRREQPDARARHAVCRHHDHPQRHGRPVAACSAPGAGPSSATICKGPTPISALIVPLAALGLILPEFTASTSGPALPSIQQRVLVADVGRALRHLPAFAGRSPQGLLRAKAAGTLPTR